MGFLFRKKKDLPEYFFKRGEECLEKDNLEWALESLNKAIELNPEHEMAYLRRAETLKRLGREREATWDLVKFMEYDRRIPDNPGDLKEVIRESIKIARMDMQRKDIRNEIVSYGIPKLLDEMMESYDPRAEYKDKKFYDLTLSWLREEPGHDGRYAGFVRLITGDPDRAIGEFKAAIEGDPGDPYPYYFTGVSLLKKTGRERKLLFGRTEGVEELSGNARSMFELALSRGLKGGVCPSCGHREYSVANFCLRCGKELLR